MATSIPIIPQRSKYRFDHPGRQLAFVWRILCCVGLLSLTGCSMQLFNPKGDIGAQEKTLILVALGLMLAVVVPVIALTLYFAWRYRASNKQAVYAPKWAHSTRIEVIVWTIPCVIVAFLAVLIWNTTHSLDPYRPLKSAVAPVRVDVVALNWKWLFIYPDYGVAAVNRLPIPVDTPIEFRLTAESLMNSFFIPQLGSQVYAMAGMQTRLHLIADMPGTYAGLSAAFSGPGFSDMHFDTVATSRAEFDDWIRQAQRSPLKLDQAAYQALEQVSSKNPVAFYAKVDPGLFNGIVNKYMRGAGAGDMPGMASAAMPMPMPMPAPMPIEHTEPMEHMAMQHTSSKLAE
jgi:cytochrome o ubiquinol oxidase subunit 2